MSAPTPRVSGLLVAVAVSLAVSSLIGIASIMWAVRSTPAPPPRVVDPMRSVWETPGAHDSFRDLYTSREVCVQYRRWERAMQDRVESMHRLCEEQGN